MLHAEGSSGNAAHMMRSNHQTWGFDSSSSQPEVDWSQNHGDHFLPESATTLLSPRQQRSRPTHLVRCQGIPASSSTNEVLYLQPRADEDVWGNVVLFPGDVQDLHHRMLSKGHGEFSEFCVENTAQLLATKFPGHAVWVVLPKTHVNGALASYDNFGRTDWASGGAVVEYRVDGSACWHLEALLDAAADAVQSLRRKGTCGAAAYARPDVSLPLTLVGFSKGAVVLNQLVTELARGAAAARPPTTPTRGSKRSESREDGGYFRSKSNRKRSRVCTRASTAAAIRYAGSDCDGAGLSASSEGVLTNPPSPSDDGCSTASNSWPTSWEVEEEEEEEEIERSKEGTRSEPCRQESRGGVSSTRDDAGSVWSRLLGTFGMSRFLTRSSSLTSLGSSTRCSGTDDDPDRAGGGVGVGDGDGDGDGDGRSGGGGGGWEAAETVQERNDVSDPDPAGSNLRRRTGREARRRRKRPTSTDPARTSCRSPQGDGYGLLADGAAQRLFERVAAIHWVDGGNGNLAGGSFPTNVCSLSRLAALPNLSIRVHGTPYQWRNPCRPFLSFEADAFLAAMEGFRVPVAPSSQKGFAIFEATCHDVNRADGAGLRVNEFPKCGAGSVAHDVNRDHEVAREGGAQTRSGKGLDRRRRRKGRVRLAGDVKRFLYFENENPSLENHFRVLGELSTD